MHDQTHGIDNYNKAFFIGITLNALYVGVEAYYGLVINSSALLADAGHNFSDVISLILAWGAAFIAKKSSNPNFTYGYRKTTILASLMNGLLIVGAAGFILYDAIHKIQNPVEIPGNTLMIVASVGLAVNTFTALLFARNRHNDLNIKGAFLHMAADAAVTLGVLVGGLVMKNTGAYWVDPVLSFIIVGVILYSAGGLLIDSVKLIMDAVPKNIDLKDVKTYLQGKARIEEVHDLHIWPLSTTEVALTAHLVIPAGCQDDYLYEIRRELHDQFGIDHCTLQVEHDFKDDEYRNEKV